MNIFFLSFTTTSTYNETDAYVLRFDITRIHTTRVIKICQAHTRIKHKTFQQKPLGRSPSDVSQRRHTHTFNNVINIFKFN